MNDETEHYDHYKAIKRSSHLADKQLKFFRFIVEKMYGPTFGNMPVKTRVSDKENQKE